MKKFKPAPNCDDVIDYGGLCANDALNQILKNAKPINGGEWIPLHNAVNRVLNENIVSTMNVPSCTNSAVDGYAISSADLSQQKPKNEFKVIETALAGQPARSIVKPFTAIRIMTGAVLPEGADTIIMQEQVEVKADSIKIHLNHRTGENIRKLGEDIKCGETVLSKGRLCNPADIGLIASLGFGEINVKRRLRVGILSTGTELRSIGTPLGKGELYDSNRYTLHSVLQRLSVDVNDYGIVIDEKKRLEDTMTAAQNDNDILITTGGVSVGQADYTREILQNTGKIIFSKVAIKPGRPLTFAIVQGIPVFGLPGNPVAVMVTFYQFVLPAIKKLMGIFPSTRWLTINARAVSRIRKKPGRTEYQRGILTRNEEGLWMVALTGRQGSGILRSMSLANALILLPHDAETINPGEEVIVQPFEPFF